MKKIILVLMLAMSLMLVACSSESVDTSDTTEDVVDTEDVVVEDTVEEDTKEEAEDTTEAVEDTEEVEDSTDAEAWQTYDVDNITLTLGEQSVIDYTAIMGNSYKNVFKTITEVPEQNAWAVTFINSNDRETPVVLCLEYNEGSATYYDVTLEVSDEEQVFYMPISTGEVDESEVTRTEVREIKMFVESGGNSDALGVTGSVTIIASEFVDYEFAE